MAGLRHAKQPNIDREISFGIPLQKCSFELFMFHTRLTSSARIRRGHFFSLLRIGNTMEVS